MKKFFSILLILFLLPTFAFATKSPTTENIIYSDPSIPYEMLDDPEMIEQIKDEELEGYIFYDAIVVELKEKHELVKWYLPVEFIAAKTVIVGESIIIQDCPIEEDGAIILDFTDLEPGIYFLCFYIKQGEENEET